MDNNGHMKNWGVRSTPHMSDDGLSRFQKDVVGFTDQVMSGRDEVRRKALRLLREADVVFAADNEGAWGALFGAHRIQAIIDGERNETNEKLVYVFLDDGETDQQAERLVKLMEELKGACLDAYGVEAAKGIPSFMFTHDGFVQFHEVANRRGMLVTRTREIAKQYVALVEKRGGVKPSIRYLHAAQAFAVQFAESLEHGANCALLIRGIAGDDLTLQVLLPHPATAEEGAGHD